MTLKFQIKKNLNEAFEYLCNTDKFATVHPVIYRIEKLSDSKFQAYEKLKVGRWHFSFSYPFYLEINEAQKSVTMKAIVFGLTKLQLDFSLVQQGEYCHITEQIQIKSLLPVKGIMMKMIPDLHGQLFKNIENAER
jgi:carbon monoxide dehydrogenase subunit G